MSVIDGKKINYILKIENVYKNFDGLGVLFGININVRYGSRHAIIGPNGAGKSTLFNLITGKHHVSKGEIFFKEQKITGIPPHRINRAGLSRSFQITNIFRTMTVFENVRNAILVKCGILYNIYSNLARMDGISQQTNEILDEIGLLDRKNLIAGELSYGEQRALEIGLTIATDPELILLDEPTAGMSSEETRATIKLIEHIAKGKTLMIIEHDMDVVFSLADQISVIYYGKVLASGPPDQVRNNQRVKDAYLGEEKERDSLCC